MGGDKFRISVEVLENGFEVEVPDMEEIAKKQAAAKKAAAKPGCCYSDPYIGDCTKCYAAKSIKEVVALVKAAIEKMPTSEKEFDAAFEEATSMEADD